MLFILVTSFPPIARAAEIPEREFQGFLDSDVIFNNIDFTDLRDSNSWAKEAIYEVGSIGAMKGYGNRIFGLNDALTKEQALALAYLAAGREAEAQQAAEVLDNARTAANKQTNAIKMWADGYIQLAFQDGLISAQDYADATSLDQTALTNQNFRRETAAQRQEFAFYLAKTLNLTPEYSQEKIFNNFNDWQQADPIKIPYLESITKNNIMNGYDGSFHPKEPVTRAQAAQIFKNAAKFVYSLMGYEKFEGTVKSIDFLTPFSNNNDLTINTFNIRNITGNLHTISVEFSDKITSEKNELNGINLPKYSKDFIVYKDGVIQKSRALKKGDIIEYIASKENTVRFVNVISNGGFEEDITTDDNIVGGIVEENNPILGYISLYNENGLKNANLKIFNYNNPKNIEILKNHAPASIQDIEEGDSVFLKLDENLKLISISAVDNYDIKYGKILSKKPSTLLVEYTDGTSQLLNINNQVLFFKDKKPSDYASITEGDRGKFVLKTTINSTNLKEVSIEGNHHLITGIYKGVLSYFDNTSNEMILQNVKYFEAGNWKLSAEKGFSAIKLADKYELYLDENKIDINYANKLLKGDEAYVAVQKSYGKAEEAVHITFRQDKDSEVPTMYDTIVSTSSGSKKFNLGKETKHLNLNAGTIIVKDGKLVLPNSILIGDKAYVVANIDYASQDYYADIVKIDTNTNKTPLHIYRAKIAIINENNDFTVNSFSELTDVIWSFQNMPKTFKLDVNTKIVTGSGLISIRDFVAYGENSYIDKIVYIVSDGINALMITDEFYTYYAFSGKIYNIESSNEAATDTTDTKASDTMANNQPTNLSIFNVKAYDHQTNLWIDTSQMTFNLLMSSIIIKDDKIISANELKKGDMLKIFTKENSGNTNANIIIVE